MTDGALKEVHNFGRHDEFVRLFESLPSHKQDHALEVFQKRLERMSPASFEGLREASEELGATQLLETIHANPRQ